MEPLINLINYLRKIARQHIEIKSFGIGEIYELNDTSNFQFPLLFLELPIVTSLQPYDLDKLSITINLHALTNVIFDNNNNPISVTESMIQSLIDQKDYTDLAVQDNLMNNAFRIINTIACKIASDAYNSKVIVNGINIPLIVENIVISNSERVTTKDIYQATATITLIINNDYLCSLDSYFDTNIN